MENGVVRRRLIMSKEFQYVGMNERLWAVYEAITKSTKSREEIESVFDFDKMTMREDMLLIAKKTVQEKILEANSAFTVDSDEVQDMTDSTINYCIKWYKHRLENGFITWDELMKRLQSIDLANSQFGIRVQHFGKTYFEIFFNYVEYGDGVIKLYNAEYPEGEDDDNVIVDTASHVIITETDIKEIYMSDCDLVPQCGLRDITITYENGENTYLRFADEFLS